MRSAARSTLALALLTVVAGVQPSTARAEELTLTLDQAVKLSLDRNVDVTVAEHGVAAAEAARKSARGLFLPQLKVDGNVILWNDDLTINFAEGIPIPIDIPPTTVRDQVTWQATVTIGQPVNVWGIYENYKVQEIGVDVARVKRETARRDTAFQVAQAYYRVLQVMRLVEVATTSVEQITAQVGRARSLLEQGVVAQNDVLRAELGLAAASQRLVQTRGQLDLARSALALAMGLPPETTIVPATLPEDTPPPLTLTAEQASDRAARQRIELREIDANIAMARAGVSASRSMLTPMLNLAATYQHSEGSTFQEENAYFVGAFLSWTAWDWGSTYYKVPQAEARLQQALAARSKVNDALRLDARAAWIGARTAGEALEIARKAVVQAEENYRIELKRYEGGASTSFDVLDAETQLTQARAQQQTALYEYLIARAALARATGELLPAEGSAR